MTKTIPQHAVDHDLTLSMAAHHYSRAKARHVLLTSWARTRVEAERDGTAAPWHGLPAVEERLEAIRKRLDWEWRLLLDACAVFETDVESALRDAASQLRGEGRLNDDHVTRSLCLLELDDRLQAHTAQVRERDLSQMAASTAESAAALAG